MPSPVSNPEFKTAVVYGQIEVEIIEGLAKLDEVEEAISVPTEADTTRVTIVELP